MVTTKERLRQHWFCNLKIMPQSKQSGMIGHKHFYTAPNKRAYAKTLATMMLRHRPGQPLEGLLELSVVFTFPWPADRSNLEKALEQVGDLDNFLKPLKDAMKKIAYGDDGQVSKYGRVEKRFGDKPGIDIWIRKLS